MADAPLRVLLVDDNRADAHKIGEFLREPGFPACEFTHVETVDAGIEAVKANGVDAVLLGLTLPDAQALDAIARMNAATPDIPLLVLTGFEDKAMALGAMQSGAQDYLVKAEITPALLARALLYAIERSRLEAARKRERASAQAAALREQFIAILSHDLNNPLNAIAMNAALLIEKAELTDRQLKTVSRIARSAARMNRMIRDLLDFTRTRLGGGFELSRAPGGLADICAQVVEEIEVAYPDRTVRLQVAGRGWGSWDADRMAQVMSNLISNGLQYGPSDAPVLISLADEGANVSIEVSNQGEAISPDMLPGIFEPYFRLRANVGSNQGLGLGLYIANQIVLAHGGRIEVRSVPGTGTTFRVVVPR